MLGVGVAEDAKELAMLVLSRKPGQRVCIGDDIEVTVLDIRGSRVRLGVNAPRHVPIDREEWHREIEIDLNGGGPGVVSLVNSMKAN